MKSTSVITRFSYVLAAVVASALLAFAIILILSDFLTASRDLKARTERLTKLAAASLEIPMWNLDYLAVSSIVASFLEDNDIVFAAVVDGDKQVSHVVQPKFENKTIEYFNNSNDFFVDRIPIRHEGETIGEVQLAMSGDRVWSELNTNVALVSAVSGLILVAVLITSGLITRRYITRRLLALEGAATAIAGGDLKAEVLVGANDEIGRLARNLGTMRDAILRLVEDLRSSRDELEHHNITLGQRVRERTAELEQAIGSAQEAQRLAEEANRAKSDFLSNMSHELRTPLNAIIGFAELVSDDDDDPVTGDQKESLGEVLRAGRHLLSLINDVLDLTKIEGGAVALSIEAIDVVQIVDECISLTTSFAIRRNVRIHNVLSGTELPAIAADRIRFKQVILNLLTNAIKYNSDPGNVFVETAPADQGKLQIGVRDEGAGIAEDRVAMLYEPFNRLGFEHSAIEGTGIGLTITKGLVDQMNGRIIVDSVVGEGATFWVEMPISTEVAERQSLEVDVENELSAVEGLILYIEDNPANLELVRKIVGRQLGIRFIDAPSGELGIERARTEMPDVILLDINLPGLDGFQVVEELRGIPEMRSIPVIALTAAATKSDIERGEAADFFAYLTKPIVARDLMATIRRALRPAAFDTAYTDELRSSGTVLIVDDMPIVLSVVREQLSRLGFSCEAVADPARALDMLKTGNYAVGLIDIGMPEMSGLELTRRLREAEREIGNYTPLVALTASDGSEAEITGYREAGMDDLLAKPVGLKQLASVLGRWCVANAVTANGAASPAISRSYAPSAQTQLPVDIARFRKIFGADDPASVREMFDLFIELSPAELKTLASAVAAKDRKQVRAAAHRFKSVAANAAAPRLTDLLHEMESEAADCPWELIERAFEKASEEYQQVMKYMKAEYAAGKD
jgi:signal transduction histidine kinase/DNA-binding response OmpR family regulator/HPt (histidine-containing phosphotransfer) domain-containing protein